MDELEIIRAGITINEFAERVGKAMKTKPTDQLADDWKHIMEAQITFRAMEKEWRMLRSRNFDLELVNNKLQAENDKLKEQNENLVNGL